MLSPEVLNFSPPSSHANLKKLNHKENSAHLNTIIDSHYYNHLVSVVVPDVGTTALPETITDALVEDCDYYKVENINIKELTNKDFIEAFVKKGRLTVLSENTSIDLDDCAALTPCGHLVLSLSRETYQKLGIEGKPSFFCAKSASRYVVRLNLRADHFCPGKKNYERFRWCLSHGPQLTFNLLIVWEPPDETICPSSVAAYFESRGHCVSVCHPKFLQRHDYNVSVPVISPTDERECCTPSELIEWLGAYSVGADLQSGEPDNFVNTYQPPVESILLGKVVYLQWTGFFTYLRIQKLFAAIRNYLSQREYVPWISLYVQGFADSPVSWRLKEHQYYTSGENNYALFLLPDRNCLTYTLLESNKRPKATSSGKRKK